MNYLAHSFLSQGREGLLIGNFIADHVRGNDFRAYPPEVTEGIKLHRNIDAFTDAHEKFLQSKRFFYEGFEKYSGILVDIYFDHLLARDFSLYSPEGLKQYCEETYKVYERNRALLPQTSLRFLDYVLENNVFYNYSTLEGIERVLYHLSHRIRHGVLLHHSLRLFEAHTKEMEAGFHAFFVDAVKEFGLPVN